MASNYNKLDLKNFKDRLANDHYANATGARRGVGKSDMTDDEKDKAYKAIDAHFGTEPATTATPKAKRGAKKAAAPKAAATKGRATGRGKRAAKKAASTGGRKPAESASVPASQNEELAALRDGAEVAKSALNGLAAAASIDPNLDVKAGAREGAELLRRSISRVREILGEDVAAPSEPAASMTPSSGEDSEPEEEEDE